MIRTIGTGWLAQCSYGKNKKVEYKKPQVGRPERKIAMISTSDKAAEKLKEALLKKFFDIGLGYRIVDNIADSNSSNILTMALDKESPGDDVTVLKGIRILIDHRSANQLADYELDYVDGPDGGFFLRQNNQKEISRV
jgi:Fe-S cluster assembly iron-binding protein IscA